MERQVVPCPFVYANGKACDGHIVRIEAFKADLSWIQRDDGSWGFDWGRPRSHFHLFCSVKGNHAGFKRSDDSRLKFYPDQLPEAIRKIVFPVEDAGK